MNKEQLRYWALQLEGELGRHRRDSQGVAKLLECKALTDAIDAAKAERIDGPLNLSALS